MATVLNSKQTLPIALALSFMEALLIATILGLFAYGYPDAARIGG